MVSLELWMNCCGIPGNDLFIYRDNLQTITSVADQCWTYCQATPLNSALQDNVLNMTLVKATTRMSLEVAFENLANEISDKTILEAVRAPIRLPEDQQEPILDHDDPMDIDPFVPPQAPSPEGLIEWGEKLLETTPSSLPFWFTF